MPRSSKYRFKRFIVWLRIKLRKAVKKINKQTPIDTTQILALEIVKKAISHEESELLLAPISGTRYIHYKEIFIRFEYGHLVIINGTYTYHIFIPALESNSLTQKFNARLEFNRKKFEKAIMSKTTRSLTNILNDLNKEL